MPDHIVTPIIRATPVRAARSLATIATALWIITALYGAELAARYSGDIVAMGTAPTQAMPSVVAPVEPRPYMPAEANPASLVNLDPVAAVCATGALTILYPNGAAWCGGNMAVRLAMQEGLVQ